MVKEGAMRQACLIEDCKQKRSVAEYIKNWGSPASIALLDPQCQLFSVDTVDGIIGYRIAGSCAVVFGDPLCAPDDLSRLVEAFKLFCKKAKKQIVYTATTKEFTEWALKSHCRAAVSFGDELVLNPCDDPKKRQGPYASMLRTKFKHSQKEGVVVHEYVGYDQELEKRISILIDTWVHGRTGPQIFLFSHIHFFNDRPLTRVFYAEHQGAVVGALFMTRIDSYQGWVMNVSMVAPTAPNTASEFMMLCVLDVLRTEHCQYFSTGPTPAPALKDFYGLGPITRWIMRHVFTRASSLFKLVNRQRYWKKFQPTNKPLFLVFSRSRIGIAEVMGIMRAFNAKL